MIQGKPTPSQAHHSKVLIRIDHLRSIEDGVRAVCGDLVFECVVVGSGRPSPTLFVEASGECAITGEEFKEEIIGRMKGFNSRGYSHERIASTEHVVIVKRGTLPRTTTKGNIRRQAVEDQYKGLLDSIYTTILKE